MEARDSTRRGTGGQPPQPPCDSRCPCGSSACAWSKRRSTSPVPRRRDADTLENDTRNALLVQIKGRASTIMMHAACSPLRRGGVTSLPANSKIPRPRPLTLMQINSFGWSAPHDSRGHGVHRDLPRRPCDDATNACCDARKLTCAVEMCVCGPENSPRTPNGEPLEPDPLASNRCER